MNRCLPTLDGFVPAEQDCAKLVQEIAAHRGPVYVHCAQGHGRSALVVGAVLLHRGLALSASDAEAKMKSVRPGVSMSFAQRRLLKRFDLSSRNGPR
jgi:protein-tyrosine phosphatase